MRWLPSSDHASLVDRDPAFVDFKCTRSAPWEHRSTPTLVLDDAVVGDGGADHHHSVGASRFSSSNQLRITCGRSAVAS